MNENITKYIIDAPEKQGNAMAQLRELIHKEIPDCIENFKWGRPVFSTNNDFIYFKSEKKYLTFGFFNFHKIKDNAELLEGTGKKMRHIKIKDLEDIDIEVISQMIKQAAQ